MAMCYSNKFHGSSVSNVADSGSFWTIRIILNVKTGIFMQNIYIDVEKYNFILWGELLIAKFCR